MESLILVMLAAFFIVGFLVLLIASLVWVHRDAEIRGKKGWLVVLMVLLLNWPVSLLVWIVFRPELR
jgi:hypothetical protein